MMTLTARLISIIIGSIVLIIISYLVRRRKIYNIYAFTWLSLSVLLILIGLFSPVVEFIRYVLGVDFTPIAILVLIIGGMLAILLHLSIIVSEQHQELKRLEKEASLFNVFKPN